MPKLVFLPSGTTVDAQPGAKLLVAAIKHKVPIRYGCAACSCGTCGVRLENPADVLPMASDEKALLERLKLPVDGTVRLACRVRIQDADVRVDLDFQDTYSP